MSPLLISKILLKNIIILLWLGWSDKHLLIFSLKFKYCCIEISNVHQIVFFFFFKPSSLETKFNFLQILFLHIFEII